MINNSISPRHDNPIDQSEKSEKKAKKNAEKNLETIFDGYISSKLLREKDTDKRMKESLQFMKQSQLDHENNTIAAKVHGFFHDDDLAKDRADSTSHLAINSSCDAMAMIAKNEEDDSDQKNISEAVEKLKNMIQTMVSQGLSNSDFFVTVEGNNGVKVNVAMIKNNQGADIYISSDSSQALDFISNQATRIEKELEDNQQLKFTLSLVF